jgi:hypothetical protein
MTSKAPPSEKGGPVTKLSSSASTQSLKSNSNTKGGVTVASAPAKSTTLAAVTAPPQWMTVLQCSGIYTTAKRSIRRP